MARKKVFLSFPQKLVSEPILWQIGKDFNIVTNIRGASISEDVAHLALLLEGENEELDRAMKFLAERGVTVDRLEEADD